MLDLHEAAPHNMLLSTGIAVSHRDDEDEHHQKAINVTTSQRLDLPKVQ